MSGKFKSDLFSSEVKFTIEEASGEVDGIHVLAKVRGPFFVPEGKSRNGRYYSKELWEKQLSRPIIQSYLKEKRMFGTIGHAQPIDDQSLLEGKISHIVTELAIDKDGVPGYGEALILGTPAGKILNTIMRANAKLFTSSRAMGSFSGQTEDGTPKVDEETYDLRTFDFVIDPGFLQAHPTIAESLDGIVESEPNNSLNSNQSMKEKNKMDTELLKRSMDEAASLRVDLEKALAQNREHESTITTLKGENSKLQESAQLAEGYGKIGTLDQVKLVQERLQQAEAQLAKLQPYGTVDEVIKAIDSSIPVLKKYKALGSPSQIQEALDKALALLEQYKPLGTPKQIDRVLEKFRGIVEKFKKNEDEKKIKALATELSVAETAVRKLWGTMPVAEMRKFFKEVRETSEASERYRKRPDSEANKDNKGSTESGRMSFRKGASLGERLMGDFSHGIETAQPLED
jgi:hypothetical protein